MQNKVAGYPDCAATAKAQARRLSLSQGGKRNLSHAQALEMVANLHGVATWAEMLAGFDSESHRKASPEDAYRGIPDMLFSYSDYFNAAGRDGTISGLPRHFTEDAPTAFRSLTKEDFLPISRLSELEEKILELFELRLALHGGRYCFGNDMSPETFEKAKSGPSSISIVGKAMVRDAGGLISAKEKCSAAKKAFFRIDGVTPREDYEFGLQRMEVERSGYRQPIRESFPDINNRHSILIASDPERWIRSLVSKCRKGTVADLFSKDTIEDLLDVSVKSRGKEAPRLLREIYRQDRAINPAEVFIRIAFGNIDGPPLPNIVILSARDMAMMTSADVLLTASRSLKTHVIIVADIPKIPESIYRQVDHIWRP